MCIRDRPYVFNGQLIKNFRVTFEKGRVVDYHAEQGQVLLGRLLDLSLIHI